MNLYLQLAKKWSCENTFNRWKFIYLKLVVQLAIFIANITGVINNLKNDSEWMAGL